MIAVDAEHEQGGFRLQVRFEADGPATALYGPSGSGKTTLVNIVAGLVRPRRGRVVADGTVLLDTEAGIFVPPHRRRIGYVFQDGRLFPHLSVRRNLLFGRPFWRRSASADAQLGPIVELLGIGPLLGRRPAGLSGGERQRVAIGRALLARPRLLLMDEPLASLDAARRAELLPYLERLRDSVGIPILYVSHAADEVARLATTVVMLEAGSVVRTGSAAATVGARQVPGPAVAGRLAAHGDGWSEVATDGGSLRVPPLDLPVGSAVRVTVEG